MAHDLPMDGSTLHSMKSLTADYILCECELRPLQQLVTELEPAYAITVQKAPSICLTMVPAEDSLEGQKFYLGEALTTECEVLVGQYPGYGLCLGDDPARAYCLAVLDAFLQNGQPLAAEIESFLRKEEQNILHREREEFDLILRTQVDFKLMEEA